MRPPVLAVGFALVIVAMLVALPVETQRTRTVDAGEPVPTSAAISLTPSTAASVVGPTSPSVAATASTTSPTSSSSTDLVWTGVVTAGEHAGANLEIRLAFVSEVADVPVEELTAFALSTLNDPRSWVQAGFRFVEDPESSLTVILAEGARVDQLCFPLRTGGSVSCQNGVVAALNATRWREATASWDATVDDYRRYLVNHEVGHLIGQRHPTPRCPAAGAPAAVMEQQTKGLEGCVGNAWPRLWEITYAAARPAVVAPLPSWAPDPVPANLESR